MGDRVTRCDIGRLSKARPGPAGSVLVPASVTCSGVFTYHLPGGAVQRELRPDSEVFSEDSLATLLNAPVTDLHPPTLVDPKNWADVSIGSVVSKPQRTDGRWVSTELQISRAEALAKIDAGERNETSCGYTCELELKPGITPDGQRYDCVQRSIRYNHVAILPTGQARAGREASFKLDSMGKQEEKRPVKFKIDGIEYDTEKDPEAACQAFAKSEKAWQKKLDDKDLTIKQRDDEIGSLKAKLDAKPDIPALVKKRVALVNKVSKLAPKLDGIDTMSDRDLMVAGIKSIRKDFDATDRSDDFLSGVFETIDVPKQDHTDQHRQLRSPTPKKDSKPRTPPKPAWQQPLNISSRQ